MLFLLYISLQETRKNFRLYCIVSRQKKRTAKANLQNLQRINKIMSIKRKLISGLTLAVAVVGFSSFASAQDNNTNPQDSTQRQERRERRGNRDGMGKEGRRGGHHGGDKMMMRGLRKLDLTDSQREQVRTIGENFRNSTQTQREEMRGLMEKKRDGVITADEQARFKDLKMQLKSSGKQMQDSILAILTGEQRAQLEQLKADRKQKMQERRQMRQDGKTSDMQKDN